MLVRGQRQVVQVALGGLLLCGAFLGTAESKKKVVQPAPAPAAEDMAVEGIAGQLDAPACERVLEQAKPDLKKCYDEVASRMYFLSGHIELKLFIGTDGKAKRIITQKSNVGSYEVERCLVQTLQKIEYPAAKGGLGEITYPMDFAGRGPLGAWGREQVAENLDKEKKKLLSCQSKAKKGGTERRAHIEEMRLTMYVAPGGQVAAAGFSSPKDPLDEGVTACLDTKVRQMKLADPLGKIVKIEYSLGGPNDSE